MDSKKIFLKARDIDSCDVISSLLQDSILHIPMLSFHDEKKCLRLMLNRFCWETQNDNNEIDNKNRRHFRVHSGLYIYNINEVTVNDNFKNTNKNKYINMLAMHVSDEEINLLFSENKRISISIDGISIYLKDLHEKYKAHVTPKHDI